MSNVTEKEHSGSWEDFINWVIKIYADIEKQEKEDPSGFFSQPIFRGHADANWKLSTTLERFTNQDTYTVLHYYENAYKIKKEVETFTGKNFGEVPPPWDFIDTINSSPIYMADLEIGTNVIEYWTYLRHHGFPSPLLDWSASPYIAAYFAFKNIGEGGENVSVYVYSENEFQTFSPSKPRIISIGSNLKAHPRHFLQKCEYTHCFVIDKNTHVFSTHENVFANSTNSHGQLLKFTIPRQEREKALKFLDLVNINLYSLFGSEDALIETLALREFYFGKNPIQTK